MSHLKAAAGDTLCTLHFSCSLCFILFESNMEGKFGQNVQNNEELRIVMVGKTGMGKSATGNTILGRQCFESKLSATSKTEKCSKGEAGVDGQQVAVIDTPGLYDTRFGMEKTTKDVGGCISYAAPGPHVFLVVIKLGRFTGEEKQSVQKIQEIFGQAADRYSMVLFTHGDSLEDATIEEFIDESPDLKQLVARCNGNYHVFNNKNKDRSQVNELLQKIRILVQKNGGRHYTNKMFQEAERVIKEEEKRILREKEEQKRKEREEIERKAQERYQIQIDQINAQHQAERERERKQRERERREERRREMEERRREMEEREALKRWEREQREREVEIMKNQLRADHERKMKEEQQRMNESYNYVYRQHTENNNNDCIIL